MSDKSHEIVVRLCAESLSSTERMRALRLFAQTNGWHPSDQIDQYAGTEEVSNGHLVVEHGLDNTAVITFLRSDSPFVDLRHRDKLRLLSLSYNNLVNWHLFPDPNGLTVVFNRVEPARPRFIPRTEMPEVWRADAFDRITAELQSPNIRALDDALIETISYWKRMLYAELEASVSNESLSTLFNHILFVRALEDHRRSQLSSVGRLLLEVLDDGRIAASGASAVFSKCLRLLGVRRLPKVLRDEQDALSPFDALDTVTLRSLFSDFYANRFAPYDYDFSLISKHALSRIYEHYVSLLRTEESPQLTLFPEVPEEIHNRRLGGVYTPQYIARFFSRFLKENLPPRSFRALRIIDPACGSGIFLRTILEMQCDPHQDVDLDASTRTAFANVMGIDVDSNACQATNLSLCLLHLILTDRLPQPLKIRNEEAIDFVQRQPNLASSFDVVVTNPPFINWNQMSPDMRDRVKTYVGQYGPGKVDLYLALLKLGLDLVKPGGFVLYVLPHSFLIARNAEKLRNLIAKEYWIRLLADLSEIPVFGDIGSYVILLVLQKREPSSADTAKSIIVRCSEFPGRALQYAVEGRLVSSDCYDVFEADQDVFENESWKILPALQTRLHDRLKRFHALEQVLEVRQGFVTGQDSVFIIDRKGVPVGEEEVWIPYLPDRDMQRYSVPADTARSVFFPFSEGKKLEVRALRNKFPRTWEYLKSHSSELKKRQAVVRSGNLWWSPVRPRSPRTMLRPKIVSPHLILLPKFGLDEQGIYAVSRSPVLFSKGPSAETEILRFMLAVLNSTVAYWQIANESHKYSHGYAMLEVKTLKKLRVPHPAVCPPKIMNRIQRLVQKRISEQGSLETERELDTLIAGLYGLEPEERAVIGMEQ